MTPRRIAVVTAGLSHPSTTRLLADRLAQAVDDELGRLGIDRRFDVIELRDHAHDITNNLLTGFAPPAWESAMNTVVSADGIIAVTPIFSTSYSGLFKSFVDVLDPRALSGTPVLLGANAGSPRHSLALDYAIRPLFTYLHADPVPTGVFAASGDWGGTDADAAPLAERITRAARELAQAIAWRGPRTGTDPYDPAGYLSGGSSFEDLLGRGAEG